MAKLIHRAITSLDGHIADADGSFAWSEPDEEVHAFVNDLERPVGTHLYGRRLYEIMTYWETAHTLPSSAPVERDYATVWQQSDKIVYSTTLPAVTTARTRIERSFDPEAVRDLKRTADCDLTIGGAHLAAQAFRAGLIDEVHLLISPILVGGGTRALPDGVRLSLALIEQRRFAGGVVHLRYRTT